MLVQEDRTVEEQALAGGRNCEDVLKIIREAKERIASANASASHIIGVDREPNEDVDDVVEGWVGLQDDDEGRPVEGTIPDYRVAAPGILDLSRKGDGYSMRVALQKDCSSVVVDEQDKNGRTPLMLACMYAKRDSILELVRVGANVHIYDKWGKTALMYAVSKGDLKATQLLLDAGANPHDTDWEGKTANEHLLPTTRSYEAITQILRLAKRKTTPMKKQASFGNGVGLRRLNSASSPTTSTSPSERKKRGLVTQKSAPPSISVLSALNGAESVDRKSVEMENGSTLDDVTATALVLDVQETCDEMSAVTST